MLHAILHCAALHNGNVRVSTACCVRTRCAVKTQYDRCARGGECFGHATSIEPSKRCSFSVVTVLGCSDGCRPLPDPSRSSANTRCWHARIALAGSWVCESASALPINASRSSVDSSACTSAAGTACDCDLERETSAQAASAAQTCEGAAQCEQVSRCHVAAACNRGSTARHGKARQSTAKHSTAHGTQASAVHSREDDDMQRPSRRVF